MDIEKEVAEIGHVLVTNDLALAKIVGFLMKELIQADPSVKQRLKMRLLDVAMHPDIDKRELTTGIAKAVAQSAGMRLPRV